MQKNLAESELTMIVPEPNINDEDPLTYLFVMEDESFYNFFLSPGFT